MNRIAVRACASVFACLLMTQNSWADLKFAHYDDSQNKILAELTAVTQKGLMVCAALPPPPSQRANIPVSFETLAAALGDVGPAEKQEMRPEFASYYKMNRYFLACEAQFRSGHPEPGRQLLDNAMNAASKAYQTGYTQGYTYSNVIRILASGGGDAQIEVLVSSIPPMANGVPGALRNAVRSIACADFCELNNIESAQKFADEIDGGDAKVAAETVLGEWYDAHGDPKKADDYFAIALTTPSVSSSSDNILKLLDHMVANKDWAAVDKTLPGLNSTDSGFRGHALNYVMSLMLVAGEPSRAEAIAGQITGSFQGYPEGAPAVNAWLTLAKFYTDKKAADKVSNAVEHAKQAAELLAVSGEKYGWGDVSLGFNARVDETVRISKCQADLQNKQAAKATLDKLSDFISGKPIHPVGYQVAQGGSDQAISYCMSTAYGSLASGYMNIGYPDQAKKIIASISDVQSRIIAQQVVDQHSGHAAAPQDARLLAMLQDQSLQTELRNCLGNGDLDRAIAVSKRIQPARLSQDDLLRLARLEAIKHQPTEVLKLARDHKFSAQETAFLGSISYDYGDPASAKALLKQALASDAGTPSASQLVFEYGDQPFRECLLLLQARCGDKAVVQNASAKLVKQISRPANAPATSPVRVSPFHQHRQPANAVIEPSYYELAMCQAIAGATARDLVWIDSLSPVQQAQALAGAAEGYLEVVSGVPTERRRYQYRQSGFN